MSARYDTRRRHRARVAPRSASGRGSRIRWDRFGRIILVLVLLVVIAMYARPVLSVADSWNDTKAEDRHLQDVQRENRRLKKRQEELRGGSEKATDGATRAARASGAVEVAPTGTETGAVSGSDAPTETGGTHPVSDPGIAVDADPLPAEPEGGTTPGGETDPAGGTAPVAGGNSGGNSGAVSG